MAVTTTFDASLSRVVIDADGIGADASYATIERSTDGVRWTTVRGAVALTVTAGEIETHYDYEWVPNVTNTYRVRGYDTGPIEFVAAGTASHANNNSITPGVPAGIAEGDLLHMLAAIRNNISGGTVNTPDGWSIARSSGSSGGMRLFAKYADADDVAGTPPTVTVSNGVAGADVSGLMWAFKRAERTPVASDSQLNASAANIAYPELAVSKDGCVVIYAGWKQDDWTSVAPPAGATEIGEPDTTTGDDQGIYAAYDIQTDAEDVSAGSLVVTGGSSADSRGMTVAFERILVDPLVSTQTDDITPTLDAVWLKSPMRPFLNIEIQIGGRDFELARTGRGEALEVADRSLPVGIGQPQGSRRYTLNIRTATAQQGQILEYLLAAGDVLFLHAPANAVVPANGVYILVESSRARLIHVAQDLQHWSVPVREMAAPGPDIAYAHLVWQTILSSYGDLDALLADNDTWDDVLALLASPEEVLVD